MTEATHWKLGLFVVAGLTVAVVALALIGTWQGGERVAVVTYFDESVDGLEAGSAVKIRGVPIGRVTGIGLAPDHRHVSVQLGISSEKLAALGLDAGVASGAELHQQMPDGLRLRLARSGITGGKHVEASFYEDPPPIPDYDFEVADNYCPSASSTFAHLADRASELLESLPAALKQIEQTTASIDQAFAGAELAQRSKQLAGTMQTTERLADELHRAVQGLRLGQLDEQVQKLAGSLQRSAGQIERLTAEDGALTSLLQKTETSLEDADLAATGTAVQQVAGDLRSLRADIRQSLASVRALAKRWDRLGALLLRQPDALLFGPAERQEGEE